MSNSSNSVSQSTLTPWRFGAALLGAAVLAGGTTFAVTNPATPEKPDASPVPDLKVEHAPVDRARTPAGSFAPIVQKVAPSVVEVFVTSKARGGQSPGDQADLLRRFFGQGRRFNLPDGGDGDGGMGVPERGLGSGVIVSTDGYILTNNHVVREASEIRVALADGREFPAKMVGTDPKTDVAVIKIKADGLPALTFADSAEVSVGDVVLAVGNPFGIGQTVTQGIVSAKDRVTSGAQDEDFIQTDAAINPGNSGGALVDTEGRLVGINAEILSRTGGNQGIGFAIPSDLCQWVMTSLIKNGRVDRGFLGVSIQNLTPALAQQFKLDRINGALVADVSAGGPADSAGFKSGDVVRQFNDKPVKDASQFKLQVAETAPGTKVTVQVVRNGETKTLEVTLKNAPNQKLASADRDSGASNSKDALSGVAVADLDQNTRSQLNVPDNVKGAVITEVRPNSPSYEAGLRAGDVITEINKQSVKNSGDAVKLTEKPAGAETLVKLWSHGGIRYLTVEENSAE